jgi:predicted nucleotidyltransferase
LVEATVEDKNLREAIDKLVEEKKAGVELGRGPRIPVISDFVEAEVNRHERPGDEIRMPPPVQKLDELFRDVLAEAWA